MAGSQQAIGLRPGDVVDGRYRIDALLGEGGFGAVFRATQLNLDRKVAIKVVLPHLLATPALLDRFLREAQVAQRLEHPNTVRMYDFGRTGDDVPYIAWELLKGRPLDDVLSRDGAMPTDRVVRIVSQVLKALMEAHGLGIVHRDIKPANIFLSDFQGEPDFVKVLDFGIAKALDVTEAAEGKNLTMAGQIIGTPNYMAPEQVEGRSVGPEADLYSLGLVMAEMLMGRTVLQGSGLAVCAAHLSPEPLPIPPAVLGSVLGPVIARATEKSLARRFASAGDMFAALRDVARAGGLDTGLLSGGGGQTGPGFQSTSSYPGADYSSPPASMPSGAVHAVATAGAGQATSGQSKLLFLLVGVLATLLVVGGVLLVVLSVFLARGDGDGDGTAGAGGQPGTGSPWGGADDGVPGPGEPFMSAPAGPHLGGNLNLLTIDIVAQRIQGAGFRLLQQPTIQDGGVVRTAVLSGLRGPATVTVMLYDYGMPMGLDIMASSLGQQPGAVRRSGSRLLYVRVMGSAPPDASEQVITALLQ